MKKLLRTRVFALCILCCLTCFQITLAQGVTPGVSKGDIFTFSTIYFWSSTDPNKLMLADAKEANQTTEIQIEVASISSSVINATITYRYQNGTEQTMTGYADISSGDNEEVGAFFFVSSSLSVGNKVYPSGLYGDTINQTLQQVYNGNLREVLLDSSTYQFQYETSVDGTPASRVLNSQVDYYFDKQTGVCVEQREQTTITDPATGSSETTVSLIELKRTNLWGGSEVEFPASIVIAGVVVLILILVALAILFSHKKHSGTLARIMNTKENKLS